MSKLLGVYRKIKRLIKALTNQADKLSAEGEPDLQGYWLCHDYINNRRGVYYFYKHKYVDYRVGDTLSLGVKKGRYPIYRVTFYSRRGSDNADFDDGRHYDLEFVRWSSKPRIPTKEMMAR